MKISLSIVFALFLCTVGYGQNVDQSVIGSTGDEFTGSSGSIEFTLGEPVSETYSTSEYQLTQGFHQGYYLFVGIEETTEFDFTTRVYPNPAVDQTTLELVGIQDFNNFEYQMYDLTGKLLRSGRFESNSIQVNLTGLSNSLYIFKIQNKNLGYAQTYQLQKIK
tara:strand:- start:392 stop:883 length:492 start_codon:yes stop_codon:yes gene_type:complete